MTVPDYLPILSRGRHKSPADGACLMEYVSILAGGKFSDDPPCTHPALSHLARRVNDCIGDAQRHTLIPYLSRLPNTSHQGELDIEVSMAMVMRMAQIQEPKMTKAGRARFRLALQGRQDYIRPDYINISLRCEADWYALHATAARLTPRDAPWAALEGARGWHNREGLDVGMRNFRDLLDELLDVHDQVVHPTPIELTPEVLLDLRRQVTPLR